METERSLAIGRKRIPIEPALRSLVLELSGYLVRHEHAAMQIPTSSAMQCICTWASSMPSMACTCAHVPDDGTWLMQRLDEVQSYMLLRRWQTGNAGELLSAQLTAAQLESLIDFYTNERAYIAVCQRLLIPLSQGKAPFQQSCLM